MVVRLAGDTIEYRGMLSEASISEVETLLAGNPDVRWLQVESPGGDVELGMVLGELVHAHRLNVRVVGDGFHSSCATYVFAAGDIKLIGTDALVSWHGSAIQHEWDEPRPGTHSDFNAVIGRMRARQYAFFELVGIDERITIVSQDLDCDCTWTLSVSDMQRFGIESVEAPPDYPRAAIDASDDVQVQWLRLPDDVFNRIRPARPRLD